MSKKILKIRSLFRWTIRNKGTSLEQFEHTNVWFHSLNRKVFWSIHHY